MYQISYCCYRIINVRDASRRNKLVYRISLLQDVYFLACNMYQLHDDGHLRYEFWDVRYPWQVKVDGWILWFTDLDYLEGIDLKLVVVFNKKTVSRFGITPYYELWSNVHFCWTLFLKYKHRNRYILGVTLLAYEDISYSWSGEVVCTSLLWCSK